MKSNFDDMVAYLEKAGVKHKVLEPAEENQSRAVAIMTDDLTKEQREFILVGASGDKTLRLGGNLEEIVIYDVAVADTAVQSDYKIENIRPKGDRIIVRVIPASDKSLGGIVIPDNVKDAPQFGTVMSTGKLVDEETKVGVKVIYGKWAGTPFEINGEEFLLMRDSDILAYP